MFLMSGQCSTSSLVDAPAAAAINVLADHAAAAWRGDEAHAKHNPDPHPPISVALNSAWTATGRRLFSSTGARPQPALLPARVPGPGLCDACITPRRSAGGASGGVLGVSRSAGPLQVHI